MKFFAFVTTALMMATFSLSAQPQLHNEIGSRFSGLEDFDLVFKTELRPNRYFRIDLIFANVQTSTEPASPWQGRLGVGLGWESRSSIDDKLMFIRGPQVNLSSNLSYATNSVNSDQFAASFNFSLGYILGAQYNISPRLYLNLEVRPAIGVSSTIVQGNLDRTLLNVGINSNQVGMTLAYRFFKKIKK